MSGLKLCPLTVTVSVILILMNQPWPLTFDIILIVNNTGNGCLQPVICRQSHGNHSSSWLLIMSPNDLYSIAKSVTYVEQNEVLVLSFLPWSLDYFQSQHNVNMAYNMCSVSCSTHFEGHVFLQSVYDTNTTRHILFDAISSDERNTHFISKSITLLLSRDKWMTYVLFSSSYEELKLTAFWTESLSSKIIMFTMDSDFHLNNSLQSIFTIHRKEDLNFVVVCSASCIRDFLCQTHRYETSFGRLSNKWLVIPTEGSAADFGQTRMQVPETDIVILDFSPCTKEYFVASWNDLQGVLCSVNSVQSSNISTPLTHYLKTVPNMVSSVGTNVYKLSTSQNEVNIRQVGRIGCHGDVAMTEDLFPGFKYGFNNRTLTVGTLEWAPFVFRKVENGSVKYSGVSIDLLKELSRTLNFSYEIVEPEDQEWGQVIDGRWTGLVGQLAYKKLDLVVAPLAIKEDREHVMDFTGSYFYADSGIILKKASSNATKWFTLIAPFRYEVHIVILFSLVFSTVFLFMVEEVNPLNSWTDYRLSARRTRYGDILWYHFGALMANGGAYLPSSVTGRSVLSCWWLFTVISSAIYSGNLIAFLSDRREKLPFNSLSEMVEQDTVMWGTLGGSVYMSLFKDSNRSDYQKIWNGLQREPYMTSLNQTLHKIKAFAGQYAYLGDETVIDHWRSETCDLQMIKDQYYLLNYAVGLPNNSIYTEIFSEHVLRINEAGLPRQWYLGWTKHSTVQCGKAMSAKRVDLVALQSAFYAAGVGVLLALIVLMVEVLYNRKCKNNKKGNSQVIADNHEDEMQAMQ